MLSPSPFREGMKRRSAHHTKGTGECIASSSDNERVWWDNGAAFRFGYRPQSPADYDGDEELAEW